MGFKWFILLLYVKKFVKNSMSLWSIAFRLCNKKVISRKNLAFVSLVDLSHEDAQGKPKVYFFQLDCLFRQNDSLTAGNIRIRWFYQTSCPFIGRVCLIRRISWNKMFVAFLEGHCSTWQLLSGRLSPYQQEANHLLDLLRRIRLVHSSLTIDREQLEEFLLKCHFLSTWTYMQRCNGFWFSDSIDSFFPVIWTNTFFFPSQVSCRLKFFWTHCQ